MNSKTNIQAYILCGGKSSRMGTDKGFVKFKDKSFIDWCLEALSHITNDIYLVTGNQEYRIFGYPLLEDIYKEKGPAGGIFTALEHSAADWNLILSCDIPGITGSVLNHLVENTPEKASVAFLSDGQNDFPLIAMYRKDCRKAFSEAIQKNELRLMNIIKKLNYKHIEVSSAENKDLNNINTQEELKNLIEKTLQI